MLIPLKTLIDESEEEKVTLFLDKFKCQKDEDIESFLKSKAIEFEHLSKARTYLICDENELENSNISELMIYGYISVALKILTVPENTSNRVRKKIDGFSAKSRGQVIDDFPCYLIGQLSKNSDVKENELTGKDLLEFANSVIAASINAVGGRYVMIECKNADKLIKFYKENDFHEIAMIPDYENPMVQMIRKVS